jgi:zinc/manganese transport system permease protein
MWAYDFMRHAFWSGIIIANVCAIISVFVVLRRTAFAAHALGHMSITGAAIGAVVGVPVIWSQIVINVISAVVMGFMGDKVKKNDLAVGIVLTFVLGIGAYFLFLFQNSYAGGVLNILFGDILTVSFEQIITLAFIAIVVLVILLIWMRPLIFATIDPIIAVSKNVSTRFLSIIFLILMALTVSMACQIVGALLVFSLMIIPGAIGIQWGRSIMAITIVSMITANLVVILALVFSFYINLPVSFCITLFLTVIYFCGYVVKRKIHI